MGPSSPGVAGEPASGTVAEHERLGRAFKAVVWSVWPTWAYVPNVSIGVECRARVWRTLTGVLPMARAVMYE